MGPTDSGVVGSAGGHVRRDVLVPGAVLENMLS